ncbi:MAG: hypothetical protein OXH59_19275, partial [Rhodospirillaceae bacterium]|nr:hypothetical protein [Rhodospirillaceae bacterium]
AMPPHVLADIAQRVERYRAGWMVKGWHKPAWIERQRQRGSAGGKAKAGKPYNGPKQQSATAEMTDADLAVLLGVSRRTLVNRKADGTVSDLFAHLANTVNAPGFAQKLGKNQAKNAATPEPVLNRTGAGERCKNPAADLHPLPALPSPALGDMRDPETRRFWQDRAARIAADRAASRRR